ncbi:hypothetical protein L0244_28405 [bacterium]|nr:hypothetical protein [bacterium]
MNRERDYTKQFQKIFDREPNSFERAILNSDDYLSWIINTVFVEFKKPAEPDDIFLFVFADRLNTARQMRIALRVEV